MNILFDHGFHDKLAHIVPANFISSYPLFNEFGGLLLKRQLYFLIVLVNIITSLLIQLMNFTNNLKFQKLDLSPQSYKL